MLLLAIKKFVSWDYLFFLGLDFLTDQATRQGANQSRIEASFVPHSRDYGGPSAAYDRRDKRAVDAPHWIDIQLRREPNVLNNLKPGQETQPLTDRLCR